jgi:hypothetical protein
MRTTGVPRYHLNSLISHHKGHEGPLRFYSISALCDRLSPVYAVTGNPVLVYGPVVSGSVISIQFLLVTEHCSLAFFSSNPDDFGAVSLRRLPPIVSFSIRLLDAYSF